MTAKSIENQFTGGKTSQKRIRRSIYDAPHIFFPLSPFPRKNGSICGKRWSINVDRSILEPRRTRSKRRNATATANAPRRRTKADRKRRCRARDTRTVRCRSGACCGSFNRIPNATGASIAELRRRLPLVSLGSAPPHRSAIVSSSRFFTFFFYFFFAAVRTHSTRPIAQFFFPGIFPRWSRSGYTSMSFIFIRSFREKILLDLFTSWSIFVMALSVFFSNSICSCSGLPHWNRNFSFVKWVHLGCLAKLDYV